MIYCRWSGWNTTLSIAANRWLERRYHSLAREAWMVQLGLKLDLWSRLVYLKSTRWCMGKSCLFVREPNSTLLAHTHTLFSGSDKAKKGWKTYLSRFSARNTIWKCLTYFSRHFPGSQPSWMEHSSAQVKDVFMEFFMTSLNANHIKIMSQWEDFQRENAWGWWVNHRCSAWQPERAFVWVNGPTSFDFIHEVWTHFCLVAWKFLLKVNGDHQWVPETFRKFSIKLQKASKLSRIGPGMNTKTSTTTSNSHRLPLLAAV